jgi:hypothetical protein
VKNPWPYLDPKSKKKMAAPYRMMRLKFEELAFDAPATGNWREARPQEADNMDAGRVTEADLHDDLFEASGVPVLKNRPWSAEEPKPT